MVENILSLLINIISTTNIGKAAGNYTAITGNKIHQCFLVNCRMLSGNDASPTGIENQHFIYCPKVYHPFMIELLSSGMDEKTILEVYPQLSPEKRNECQGCLLSHDYFD